MSAPGATSFRQPFVRGASGQHAPRAQGRDRAIVGHIGHTVSWWWLAVDASYPRPCLMGAGGAHLEAFGALGPRRRAELEGVVAQRDDVRQCACGVRLVRRARGPREVDLAPDERLHLRQLALQLAGSRSVHSLGSSRRATASSALRLPTLTAPPPTAPAQYQPTRPNRRLHPTLVWTRTNATHSPHVQDLIDDHAGGRGQATSSPRPTPPPPLITTYLRPSAREPAPAP